ncbi:MAG: ATP synthase F1 subunit epsilon [Patescibacteria group bacterium]|jgi:F-type H+-transporting ATPase subunit epsilon
MSKKTIKFEIATPERVVLKEEIRQVTLPTAEGELTILPEHIPLVSILKPGVLEIKKMDDSLDVMAVSGGFLEVMRDKIVILADTAERAVELDEQRIEEARVRAEDAKKNAVDIDEVEFARIAAKLEKELARTRALNRWRKIRGN